MKIPGIGDRIKGRREQLGLSLSDVDKAAAIAPGYTGKIEAGERGAGWQVYVKIAKVLHVRLEWLLVQEGAMELGEEEPAIPQDWHEIEQEDRELLSALMRRLRCVRERHADPPQEQTDCGEPEQPTGEELLDEAQRRLDDLALKESGLSRTDFDPPTPRKRREEPS